jgi:hypothetical protein
MLAKGDSSLSLRSTSDMPSINGYCIYRKVNFKFLGEEKPIVFNDNQTLSLTVDLFLCVILSMTAQEFRVAVLHQATPPPAIGGVLKPIKQGNLWDATLI